MKRGITALLALLLLLAVTAWAEDEPAPIEPDAADAIVVQASCSIVPSGEYYLVYCFAQVHNPTDKVLCLDRGMLQLRNGEQSLATQSISQLWPYFLNPGQDGYFFDIVPFEPNEDGVVVPTVTGIEYFAEYMTVDAQFAGIPLGCEARIERDPLDGALYAVCELSNPLDEPAYDPSICFGLYTDNGTMIYADGMTAQGIGVPAGGTTLVRFSVDEFFVGQWESYGVSAAQIQAQAICRKDAD